MLVAGTAVVATAAVLLMDGVTGGSAASLLDFFAVLV